MSRATVSFHILFLLRQWLSNFWAIIIDFFWAISSKEIRIDGWEICSLLRIAAVRFIHLLDVFPVFITLLLSLNFAWFCTAITKKGKPTAADISSTYALTTKKFNAACYHSPNSQETQDFITNEVMHYRWEYRCNELRSPWKVRMCALNFHAPNLLIFRIQHTKSNRIRRNHLFSKCFEHQPSRWFE